MRGSYAVLLALLVVATGCAAPSPSSSPSTSTAPTTTDTERPSTPSESETPTPEPPSVEYVVRAGDVPDAFESVTVTIEVVYVEQPDDLGSCYPDVFSGPYKPTLTPLPTPSGRCGASRSMRVDLTEIASGQSLLTDTAPAWASGHAVIVTEATATYRNGTQVTEMKGIGGFEVFRASSPPAGVYEMRIDAGAAPTGADYDYWVDGERVNSGG